MKTTSRRNFLREALGIVLTGLSAIVFSLIPGRMTIALASTRIQPEPDLTGYNPTEHLYSYIIDLHKCIGCGSCVQACKRENDVPSGFSEPGWRGTSQALNRNVLTSTRLMEDFLAFQRLQQAFRASQKPILFPRCAITAPRPPAFRYVLSGRPSRLLTV